MVIVENIFLYFDTNRIRHRLRLIKGIVMLPPYVNTYLYISKKTIIVIKTKTIREIGEDAKHAELLSKMASPESKGGLKKRNSKSKKDNISSEQSVDSTEE